MFGFKVVRQNHVGLIETLGKYRREVDAGLSFYVPMFQKVRIVDLAMIPFKILIILDHKGITQIGALFQIIVG
ncbi:hypothetical protein COSHB9_06970 [Companilactobacillus alimentarius]|uniref:SPFH domain-containing protein n=1 Tax=Companilactobacillus alimentarius TaxID=1602 RepID=UPI0028B535A7|nr:SPFH domain-containing protein [Companilactobacillus alimentarius]MDT6953155.1 SPFH domain-containing protein [Companilactobacillus alimentarius]